MSLLEKIQNKHLELRKIKSPLVNTTSPLIGDIQLKAHQISEELTDEHVQQVVTMHLKGMIINIEHGVDVDQDAMDLLKSWLPQQMSSDEILAILQENQFTNIGAAQKHFAANHRGQYDGKLVAMLFKQHNG